MRSNALLAAPLEQPPASPITHTLERALAILRTFEGSTAPLTHSEIVRRTGYSKASVSRISATLVSLGYLARDADGVRLRIGLRGRLIGRTYRANSVLGAVVRPVLLAFSERHDLTMALGIADGTEMLYVEYCKSPGTSTLCMATGGRVPMELTAMGRTWLWSRAEAERASLLQRIGRVAGRGRPSAMRNTAAAFGQLDAEGWCAASGEFRRDSWGAAVLVHVGTPAVPMGLSCAGMLPMPHENHLRTVVAPALKETALELRRALAKVDSEKF